MAKVMFIQFLMPHGRQSPQFIDLPQEVADKAKRIQDSGLQLEMELLSDYRTCSFTVTHPERGDLSQKQCPNGPEVIQTVIALIMEYPLDG